MEWNITNVSIYMCGLRCSFWAIYKPDEYIGAVYALAHVSVYIPAAISDAGRKASNPARALTMVQYAWIELVRINAVP